MRDYNVVLVELRYRTGGFTYGLVEFAVSDIHMLNAGMEAVLVDRSDYAALLRRAETHPVLTLSACSTRELFAELDRRWEAK